MSRNDQWGECSSAYRVVVGVQVRDEDGGDVGQDGVHGVSVVSAELAEGSLATVQQQRLARAAANRKQEMTTFRIKLTNS